MRVTSASARTTASAAARASFALCEPVRSEPGMMRIFGAAIDQLAVGTTHRATLAAAGSLAFAIHPHAGGWKVHPDPLGGLGGHAGKRLRNRRRDRIGELHKRCAGRQRGKGVADQLQAYG